MQSRGPGRSNRRNRERERERERERVKERIDDVDTSIIVKVQNSVFIHILAITAFSNIPLSLRLEY